MSACPHSVYIEITYLHGLRKRVSSMFNCLPVYSTHDSPLVGMTMSNDSSRYILTDQLGLQVNTDTWNHEAYGTSFSIQLLDYPS